MKFSTAIGIDPTIDFACKRVLGSPEHPAITFHFLNAVNILVATDASESFLASARLLQTLCAKRRCTVQLAQIRLCETGQEPKEYVAFIANWKICIPQ